MECKQVLKLIENAKWDCKKATKVNVQNLQKSKISYLTKKFPKKFKKTKNFLNIKGRFFTHSQLEKLEGVGISYKEICTCDNCNSYSKCIKNIGVKHFSIIELFKRYEKMYHKLIGSRLSQIDKEELRAKILYHFQEAIYYFNEKKNCKFSTHIHTWFFATIQAFFKENFDKNLRYEHELRDEIDLNDLEFLSVTTVGKFDLSELYLSDLTKQELFIVKFVYDVENYTNEQAFEDVQHIIKIEKHHFFEALKQTNHYKSLSKILEISPTEVKSIEKSAIIKIRSHLQKNKLQYADVI